LETRWKKVYTHYTPNSATGIDRIYVSELFIQHKRHTETTAAAFTDHLAVFMYIEFPTSGAERGSGYWKLNATLLNVEQVKVTFRSEWENWKAKAKYFQSKVIWWCRYVKPRIRTFFGRIGRQKRDDRRKMEAFYYEAMYEILRADMDQGRRAVEMKRIKGKTLRLNSDHCKRLMIDSGPASQHTREEPTLFHIIREEKRNLQRAVHSLTLEN
jgi:hypothetical protein